MSIYGNYAHNNGITFHDHGFYAAEQNAGMQIIGNIIMNSYGFGIISREPKPTEDILIAGNIIGWNGGRTLQPGGLNIQYQHNAFFHSDDQFVQMGGRTRGTMFDNNLFYGTTSVVLNSLSGSC